MPAAWNDVQSYRQLPESQGVTHNSNPHNNTNSVINTVILIYATVSHVSIGLADIRRMVDETLEGRRYAAGRLRM